MVRGVLRLRAENLCGAIAYALGGSDIELAVYDARRTQRGAAGV